MDPRRRVSGRRGRPDEAAQPRRVTGNVVRSDVLVARMSSRMRRQRSTSPGFAAIQAST
jgi:hypothetical protein